MSWFSVALPNPFKTLQFSDGENEDEACPESRQNDTVSSPSGGVKDDLSAIGESIGRQLRGVASFLAPPPTAFAGEYSGDSTSVNLAGIRSDLAEIGGSFKSSLSLFASTRAVSEISKIASNFLQLNYLNADSDEHRGESGNAYSNDDYGGEDEYEGAGITDGVIEFANRICYSPELWTDFPLSFDQESDMSDAQIEHVSVIEELVPSLTDLRSRLCCEMSEKQFWMIYFILLFPRLNEDNLDLLSTPEIVNARELLLVMLRSKNDTEINSENCQSDGSLNVDSRVNVGEIEKGHFLEKATISENSTASKRSEYDPKLVKEEHENPNNWLEEGDFITNASSSPPNRFQIEDDVSFSDLEDDDTQLPNRPEKSRASSSEESNEWVQLNRSAGISGSHSKTQLSSRDRESEGEESSGWLTVDDFDA